MKYKVKFLLDKNSNEAFAVFVQNFTDYAKQFHQCYSHTGQHSSVHIEYAKQCFPADIVQYRDLLNELQELGYELEIVNDHIMYIPAEAIEAITARIAGEWDNQQLIKLGSLLPDPLEDIARIIQLTEK